MRIAQIAPLFERVPPKLYGGTERVVSYLTEELVRQGHEVTLFASGDSISTARLVACSDTALRLSPNVRDPVPYVIVLLDKVRQQASDFDILHFHTDMVHFPLAKNLGVPSVTTLHGRLDLPDLEPLYRAFSDQALVSISDYQRLPMPPVNWAGTVYHGLPRNLLPFVARPRGGYLAFLGRISPEKRPDRAIEIAARTGMQLKMAAKIDKIDQPYWDEVIGPLVARSPHVEFIGEIDERQKAELLGNAAALLFPIDWPEPFGLVMIESMACGTPVIAFGCGSVPEIVDHGVTGFVVHTADEAVAAVENLATLERGLVRATFERRFSATRMADDYLEVYLSLMDDEARSTRLQMPAHRPRELRLTA